MTGGYQRPDGRAAGDLRPVSITLDAFGYADASVLLQLGNTKVLCGITLQQGVPHFLKNQRVGWLTAEYAMLPGATHQRSQRDSSQAQRNARGVEISRLVGRCLRPTVDLTVLGERTIYIDCDVLQADGSTRVACITAASLALSIANQRWMARKTIDKSVVLMSVAGISAGIVQGTPCVDISYAEDSEAHADFNFIMSDTGMVIEIQGTAEKSPLPWAQFDQLRVLACEGIAKIFATTAATFAGLPESAFLVQPAHQAPKPHGKPPLFSLANRLAK